MINLLFMHLRLIICTVVLFSIAFIVSSIRFLLWMIDGTEYSKFVMCIMLHGHILCLYLIRLFTGIKIDLLGFKDIKNIRSESGSGFIVFAKHESIIDPFLIIPRIGDICLILKTWVMIMPIFGLIAISYSKKLVIVSGKPNVMDVRKFVRKSAKALKNGLQMMVFPQGHRTPVNSSVDEFPYKIGGILMTMKASGAPLLPIALNTGSAWGRGLMPNRFDGHVMCELLEPIYYKSGEEKEAIFKAIKIVEDKTKELTQSVC